MSTFFGRVLAIRKHKASIFLDVMTSRGATEQVLVQRKAPIDKLTLNVGDIVMVTGLPVTTSRGFPAIEVQHLRLLTEAYRSPPKRLARRLPSDLAQARFYDALRGGKYRLIWEFKQSLYHELSSFLWGAGFVEVRTPVLSNCRGAQYAEPFETYQREGAERRYLRVTLEMELKQVVVATLCPVFEVGHVFRNMGSSRDHVQEYCVLELVRPGWALQDLISLIHGIASLTLDLVRTSGLPYNVHFDVPMSTYTVASLLEEYASQSPQRPPPPLTHPPAPHASATAFEHHVRPNLKNSTIVTHFPHGSPLARWDDNQALEMEWIVEGVSLAHGYEDETDPIVLEERFQQQCAILARSGIAGSIDVAWLETITYGLPPSASLCIGLDRLLFVLLGLPNVQAAVNTLGT